MNLLRTGHFFGETNRRICLDGITLTDTEYTHERVDWHYHENAYFTFILQGKLIEGNKKESYNWRHSTNQIGIEFQTGKRILLVFCK